RALVERPERAARIGAGGHQVSVGLEDHRRSIDMWEELLTDVLPGVRPTATAPLAATAPPAPEIAAPATAVGSLERMLPWLRARRPARPPGGRRGAGGGGPPRAPSRAARVLGTGPPPPPDRGSGRPGPPRARLGAPPRPQPARLGGRGGGAPPEETSPPVDNA